MQLGNHCFISLNRMLTKPETMTPYSRKEFEACMGVPTHAGFVHTQVSAHPI